MSNEKTMEILRSEADNALNKQDREMIWRALGMVLMAARLEAITYDQLMELHEKLMRNGLQQLRRS